MTAEFTPNDIIVELDESHAPYEIGVFFLRAYDEYGRPTWNNSNNPALQYWSFPADFPLRIAIDDAGLEWRVDYDWSPTMVTSVKYKSGTLRSVYHIPVFFFKSKSELMRVKLYMN